MSWSSWLLWGFAGTVVLTLVIAAAQGAGLTRMNIPFLLGTMLTGDRDRAKVAGIGVHLLNGWVFSLLYVVAFHAWGGPTWWKGAAIGLVHAAFVLGVALPALPGIHPRMASETSGPTAMRVLEPPGFLALHYGMGTPIATVVAHVVFGLVLGTFYTAG